MKTVNKIFTVTLLSAAVCSLQAAPIINVSDEGAADAGAAQSLFFSKLKAYTTEDFEGETAAVDSGDQFYSKAFSVGTFSVAPGDTGSGGACDTGGFACDAGLAILDDANTPFSGRFATSPDNWLDSMDAEKMTFSPMGGYNAVGFFMTDPNDAGGRFDIGASSYTFSDVFGSALGSGKVFYVSIYDSEGLGDVSIYSNAASDGYGIDDVTVGKVPEPGTLALLGLGLAGLGMGYRRRS